MEVSAAVDELLPLRLARTARTPIASTVPEPVGDPAGPGLWKHKGWELPPYIQHVANDLIQSGHPESEAVHMAVGIVENWKNGHDGHGHAVHPDVRAAATKAWAEWEALRARAHASRSADPETRSTPMADLYDADGLDASWDGDHADLPDLTGLGVQEFDAAAGADPGEARRAAPPKLGTGTRFTKLKASLAAKGASNPEALAAWIGRKKLGKGRFTALAAKARHGSRGAAQRAVYEPAPYHRDTGESVQCPRCGKYDDPDARFCDQCGNRLPGRHAPYTRQADETVTCPVCKKGNDTDASYCDQCGTKLAGRSDVTVAAGAPAPATASRGDIFRMYPLEECKILSRADGDRSGRVVEAYAAIFDTPAEIHDHEGHYQEEIARNAFDAAIEEARPERNGGFWRVACLYNHGMTVHGTPAERFSLPAGVTRHISAEGKGLLTRTEYAATPLGDELLELVNMGALRSQSFTGGIVRSSPMLRGPGDRYRRLAGGGLQLVRRLVLGLREYGLTPFAAYTGAEVLGVRMQLPTSAYDDAEGWDEVSGAPGGDENAGGNGVPPEAGPEVEPSTGNRLYRLRTQELLERHGIDLR